MNRRTKLILCSPYNDKKLSFKYNTKRLGYLYLLNGFCYLMNNFVERIKFLDIFFKEMKVSIPTSFEGWSFRRIRTLCKIFNRGVKIYKKIANYRNSTAEGLCDYEYQCIATYIYVKAVKKYESVNASEDQFLYSMFDKMRSKEFKIILNKFDLTPNDNLYILGGNLGFMALKAATICKAKKVIAIENSYRNFELSLTLKKHFDYVMEFGNFIYKKNVELKKYSFLDREVVKTIRNEATSVFVNDRNFERNLVQEIQNEILNHLNDGTKVVIATNLADRSTHSSEMNECAENFIKFHEKISATRLLPSVYIHSTFNYYKIDRRQFRNNTNEKNLITNESSTKEE